MPLRLVQVNIKAADEVVLGRFWADVLGWDTESEGPGVVNLVPGDIVWPDPAAVCVDLVRVPDPETVKYRAYLELATASSGQKAEMLTRLRSLGATAHDAAPNAFQGTLLADPEGNVFSVLAPEASPQGTGPIAAVVVPCADPRAMARFWDAALDWTLHEVSDDHARLRSAKGVGPYLEFRRTAPAAEPVWTRIHLDVMPYAGDDQRLEVDRLHALGAVDVDLGQGDDASWKVLADPEGNEFCVLRPR
ncbi:MAG: VOC family protein [Catenulispora sp.]|nr:VOC family protein [Catenulispora sp.]